MIRSLNRLLLASAVGLLAIGAAQAADLPTKKTAPAPAAPNCYASFGSWLDSSPADCPLSLYGVTVYGAIDVGGGYETNASRLNKDYPQGVQELINKTNNGGRWQLVPNGLSQSNVGVKIKEEIVPNWFIVGDVNFGFDPYSLQFANGPRSLVDNNHDALANQTSNSDSSRSTDWDNTRAFLGVNNTTLGTLTAGRQYAFSNDLVNNYDPFGGSYAFSMIGNSSTFVAGTGDTETARYNTSVKYQVAYNGFRAGALTQIGGWNDGNGAQSAYQFDLGGDYAGFSVDAIYAYAKDAVKLSTYNGATPTLDPSDTLKATLANVNAGVIAAKYKWNALTVYGGYEYARLSNPSDAYGATAAGAAPNGTYFSSLNGGYPAAIQALAYVNPEDLQVLWAGGKYGILSNLDFIAGYYYAWQNNYTNAKTSYNTGNGAGGYGTKTAVGVGCGPNLNPAITGATPQGANAGACAGHEDAISAMLDWRPVKRVDLYTGVMYSEVAGGLANGYIHSNNTAFTSGVRISF
jgi:predicted porin